MKGTYILAIFLRKDSNVRIGALGNVSFAKGFYLYAGSAMGDNGSSTLVNRVKRHLSPSNNKKFHWHIDYLLENNNLAIIRLYLIPSAQRLECIIAQELLDISDGYIEKFGSSDCNCSSHLIFFENFIGFS